MAIPMITCEAVCSEASHTFPFHSVSTFTEEGNTLDSALDSPNPLGFHDAQLACIPPRHPTPVPLYKYLIGHLSTHVGVYTAAIQAALLF